MFQQLMKQVTELSIDTEERLKGVIDLIFEKAISEPNFSVAYANMCRCLMGVSALSSSEPPVSSFDIFREVGLQRTLGCGYRSITSLRGCRSAAECHYSSVNFYFSLGGRIPARTNTQEPRGSLSHFKGLTFKLQDSVEMTVLSYNLSAD